MDLLGIARKETKLWEQDSLAWILISFQMIWDAAVKLERPSFG